MTVLDHLIGLGVWVVFLAAGWVLLGLAGKLLHRRRVTAPFQVWRATWWRWCPAVLTVYRTCGDCGEPSRLAVEEDFEDALAGDLVPSRCKGCRAIWLAANPLFTRARPARSASGQPG